MSKRNDNPYAGSRASWIDPATLMRIKSLQMRAKVVVEGFYNGLHRSPYHGFSVEFSEYRQYTWGDDPRYLDWKLYARTDRYYIKRFEDETSLRCYLLVDLSRSMSFASQGYSKAEYAKTCAATLSYFLSTQRDAVGLVTFDQSVDQVIPARHRPGHLHQLLAHLERAEGGAETRLAPPLEEIAQRVRKRGVVILLSDMLTSLEGLERQLACLRALGHEAVLFRVLDPAELRFEFDQPALFEDLESGREMYVDPAAARAEYLQRFAEHAERLRGICGNLDIELIELDTARPLELALFDFMQLRMRRSAPVRRRAQGGRR